MNIMSDSVKLYYKVIGKGEPVLFIHGNGASADVFNKTAEILSSDSPFACYLADSRCHGKSVDAPHISYEAMANDYVNLIENSIGEKTHVVGHSDGGIIGLILALKIPQLIKSVTALGANSTPEGLAMHFRLLSRVRYFFTRDKLTALMLREPHLTPELLKKITVPVNIIAGEYDLVKRSDTAFLAGNIPGAVCEIIKGEHHSSYVTNEKKLVPILKKYLKSE